MTSGLEAFINRAQDEATTDTQLKHALNGDVVVITYDELFNRTNAGDITNLFTEAHTNNVVILYPVQSRLSGHYVALMYYPEDNLISYFDPYGYSIMKAISLSHILHEYDKRMRDYLPELLNNFRLGGGRVLVNDREFQKRSDEDLATCGKHCTARILFRNIKSHDSYFNFLKYKSLTKDEIVSLMFL